MNKYYLFAKCCREPALKNLTHVKPGRPTLPWAGLLYDNSAQATSQCGGNQGQSQACARSPGCVRGCCACRRALRWPCARTSAEAAVTEGSAESPSTVHRKECALSAELKRNTGRFSPARSPCATTIINRCLLSSDCNSGIVCVTVAKQQGKKVHRLSLPGASILVKEMESKMKSKYKITYFTMCNEKIESVR